MKFSTECMLLSTLQSVLNELKDSQDPYDKGLTDCATWIMAQLDRDTEVSRVVM